MTAPARLTQVLLIRASGPARGIKQEVCWIDSEFAHKGRRLRDLDLEDAGISPEGSAWIVTEVYNTREFVDVEAQRAVWERFAEVLS